MQRTRIALVGMAIALVVIFFNLPKVVVDNEKNDMGDNPGSGTDSTSSLHNFDIPDADRELMVDLREKLEVAGNNKKSAIFADSLASLFRTLNLFDSTAKYVELKAKVYPNEDNWMKAGEAFYEAQTFSQDPVRGENLGAKARSYFQMILDNNPNNLEVLTKMAMTYVASSNPMKGIVMLRQVLEKDPDNKEALFNMGMLSLQSAQYDKAVERFLKLVEVDPDNLNARFYLGVSYLENKDKMKAKEQFEIVKLKNKDPEVQANVDAYLNEIN